MKPKSKLIITILVDNKKSWFDKFANYLNSEIKKIGHDSVYVNDKENIREGDVCFLLSCTKILSKKYLNLNKYNIVIHASDLPIGKGFSPLQWQILEGKNDIPITLFNAGEELDAGDYFIKDTLKYEGHELLDELREKMGKKINEMAITFIQEINSLRAKKQEGNSTFYSRRTRADDLIDPSKSINELFNHLRIADNDKFPVYFKYLGYSYILKIEKVNIE